MGFFDKMKDIVNPKDIDEGYEDDEYVFDDNGAADYGTSYDNAYNGSQATNYAPSRQTGSFSNVGVGSGLELNGSRSTGTALIRSPIILSASAP